MINSTLEIPSSLQKNPCDRHGCTLLSRRSLGYQLEISREASGRIRGWITVDETREEVKLNGLPTYLTRQRATQLFKQSYLKFQKGAIEVFPRNLGGMQCAEACKKQVSTPSENDIYSLVEIISNEREKGTVRTAVVMLLKNDPEKKDLYLRNNEIGDAGAKALAAALQVNQSIQRLTLQGNQISTAGAKALAPALQVNQSIQMLDLSGNQIGDAGVQILGSVLQVNQSIRTLYLGGNQIGDAGVQVLGTALQVTQSIRTLNLNSNKIGATGAQALGDALKTNQSIHSLSLEHNQIDDDGVQALGAALQVNQSLQSLNLGHNLIGNVGAQALGIALQVNQSIQSLNLGNNLIGDTGAQALGKALQVHHTLQMLNLFDNQIGAEGAQALATALQVNQLLQTLSLSRNQIGPVGAQTLGIALQINQSLQSLNLSSNQIGDAGAQALGTVLQVNQSLQSLNFEYNQIGAEGTQALGAALQVNQTLQTLCLFGNQIGNAGTQALIAALQLNYTLKSLSIEDNQIGDAGTKKQIYALLQANQQIAPRFQRQIKEVQKFLQLHENDEGIPLQNLPQLQELLQKWHTDSKNIISSLEKILIESGRTNLNDRYRKKLEGIITDLTNRLHNLWLESFEKKVVALSNEYVMGKDPSEERNVDLGYALYDMWLAFLGPNCPNWVEDHLQSLVPFSVLLDIAEGGGKQNITDLTDAHSLFQRVLSFSNESKDSLLV